MLPLLTGCGSVFDTAPYDPINVAAKANPNGPTTPASASCVSAPLPAGDPLLVFRDYSDAADKLCMLAAGYLRQRNAIMRQKLLIDLPAIGLGVATAANGVFGGAKDLTLALGIGSAGAAGTSLYFSPSTRISAYHSASKALLCASNVSRQINDIGPDKAQPLLASLAVDIAAATAMITQGPTATITKDQISSLITARDNATKAQSDLDATANLLATGRGQLEQFATKTITSADDAVVTGTQNLDAVLSLIKAQSGTGSAGTTTPAAPHIAGAEIAGKAPTPPPLTADELIQRLNNDAALAADLTKSVDNAWSGLVTCPST
jgi:hypothetical protein